MTAGLLILQLAIHASALSVNNHTGPAIKLQAPAGKRRANGFEQNLAAAEGLCIKGDAQSLRIAIAKYRQVLLKARAVNNLKVVEQSLLRLGDMHFTLSEYQKSLTFYEDALETTRKTGDRQAEVMALNKLGAVCLDLGKRERALSYCNQSYEISRQDKYCEGEAQAINNLGLLSYVSSDLIKATELFNEALKIRVAINDVRGQAETLINIGYTLSNLGDTEKALEKLELALKLCRSVNEVRSQALALTAIGGIQSFLGHKQTALDYHTRAMTIFKTIGDRNGQAAALNGIGFIYDRLGEREKALNSYTRALELYQQVGNRSGIGITSGYVAEMCYALGERQKALDFFNQKLILSRSAQDRRMEAFTLRDIGIVFESLGDKQRALEHYNQSLALSRASYDRRAQAYGLNSIGYIYQSGGDLHKALDYYNEALALISSTQDSEGKASTWYNIACVEMALGNLDESRKKIEESIKTIESVRSSISGPQHRTTYMARVYHCYSFYVDLLMQMHQKYPLAGFLALAFEANEHARARALMDTLAEAQVNIREGVPPELLERERTLKKQINARAEQQARLSKPAGKAQEKEGVEKERVEKERVEKEIDSLLTEYEEVQAEIRYKSPSITTLANSETLTVPLIQQHLLDHDTLLLEYSLGEKRSYVWAVTHDSITAFELPRRSEIEDVAKQVYNLLSLENWRDKDEPYSQKQEQQAWDETRFPALAAKLSRMVLGPIANLLGKKRLMIVADGALQYIPFAMLPEIETPQQLNGSYKPLLSDYEIVSLPSATTLYVMRKENKGRAIPPKTVAILADPIFDLRDVRFALSKATEAKKKTRNLPTPSLNSDTSRDLQSSAEESGMRAEEGGFRRLPFSLQEASAITALVPGQESLTATGFDATLTNATIPELRQYRIIHFATHGLLNNVHPELSGLVFSLFDRKGHPQNGFLRLHDIYNLKLPVELVVLSACRTGLGKEMKGEGLVGMTQGFMHAGAARVVASLWKIDDRASAEFMKYFYQGMLGEKRLSAAAALREAQLMMWQSKRWRFPFYWSAFILLGEWN
jgi:CHAT domain-containing protein/tetratricopeptide (TPR) repeat protein